MLLNALLQNYKWVIDEENAGAVIFDMEYAKILPNGTLDKGSRSDPTKQLDAIDTVRYWCDRFMKWFLKAQTGVAVTPAANSDPSKDRYFKAIRAEMIDKAEELINKGNTSAAQKTLDEIQRLDRLYLVKTS